MYFDDFNKLAYDFKTGLNNSRELVVVKDITQNIRFRKEFLNSLLLYNAYTVIDGETPEIISEKLYGSPLYHWIIMLVNDRYDYINDFPLDGNKLSAMIKSKYGDRDLDVHHFVNLNGKTVPGYQIMSIPNFTFTEIVDDEEQIVYIYDRMTTGMFLKTQIVINGVSDSYTGIIESIDSASKKVNVLLMAGAFSVSDVINIVQYIQNSSGDLVEEIVASFTLSEVDYPYNVLPVTNNEYEFSINEAKRNLRVIPKAYLDQIMTEFSNVMTK